MATRQTVILNTTTGLYEFPLGQPKSVFQFVYDFAVLGGAPFSAGGVKVTIPLIGTIATWIKTTAARTPAIVISVANVTAGKFNLFCEGYLSS